MVLGENMRFLTAVAAPYMGSKSHSLEAIGYGMGLLAKTTMRTTGRTLMTYRLEDI